MERNGWIKLHRKLLDSVVFQNEKALKIWVWCLLRANHKESSVLIGRTKITLNKGQFIMGSKKESEFLDIAKTTFWRWLEFFHEEGMVELKKTTKYTIVTIPNWDSYQDEWNSNGTQNGTQLGTDKNDKKEKNTSELRSQPYEIREGTDEEKPSRVSGKERQAYESLLKWAEAERGSVFVHRTKQYGALESARRVGIKSIQLKERWLEMAEDKFWQDKGFDWTHVVSSFNRKGV